MRTVYLGTSAFAADVLERLGTTEHRPVLVVTRPDRPSGRGRRLASPPVADMARGLGLELTQPEDVNGAESRERIAQADPDYLCVCAFGALIREPLLSAHTILNVHPSLLPRWRGAAPVERAIMAGDRETGVSIMRLTAGLDSGPVGLTARVPIAELETYGSLAARLAGVGSDLLIEALERPPTFVEQSQEGVTYAEKIVASDRVLDPLTHDAPALDRQVRALTPHIGARLHLARSGLLGIQKAVLAADEHDSPPAGELLVREDRRLLLGCSSGSLELLVVQPAGGRPMPVADYLRGLAGPPG